MLNSFLAATIRWLVIISSAGGNVPAADHLQHSSGFCIQIREHSAEKLAEDQRIDQRRAVFALDGGQHRSFVGLATVASIGKIGFVGSAPIVIGPARSDGKAQRHGLSGARFVTGNFQSFNVCRQSYGLRTDLLTQATTSFGQIVADSLPPRRSAPGAQQRLAVAKTEPVDVQPAAFDTFHGKGNRASGANGVHAQFVTEPRGFSTITVGSSISHSDPRANRFSYSNPHVVDA